MLGRFQQYKMFWNRIKISLFFLLVQELYEHTSYKMYVYNTLLYGGVHIYYMMLTYFIYWGVYIQHYYTKLGFGCFFSTKSLFGINE